MKIQNIKCALFIFFIPPLLLACSESNSGGNIGFSDGQNPDPVVIDVPIAYVKRALPVDDNMILQMSDAREPVDFNPGGDLYVRERASPTAVEVNITFEITQGMGDVKNVQVNAEGSKLVFSLREPMLEDVDEEDQPTWNIWEYELETQTLRRIITSDINSEAGHDVAPHYLPDGRIVFSSDRQRQSKAILLDEGKPQYSGLDEDENVRAMVLHVMNDDGSDIRQITFNQSHDSYPMVRNDGTLIFSRWGATGGNDSYSLYQANPDGSNVQLLYGVNSFLTGSNDEFVNFMRPQEMPDGRIGVLLQTFTPSNFGGQIVLIDSDGYVENTQAVLNNAGATGPAQEKGTANEVRTDSLPSGGGRYSSFYPLWDGTERLFVSWSQCRLEINNVIQPCTTENLALPGAVEADPLYGVWVYDMSNDTQLPIVTPEEGIMVTDVVAAQPKTLPAIVFDQMPGVELDADLHAEGVGLLHIRSVYDIEGMNSIGPAPTSIGDPALITADQRPARFVRIVKGVSIPDDDVVDVPRFAFGPARSLGMKEVIGYTPVEPDGSVLVAVPADTALAISVLNKEGKRITQRHDAWVTVRPGEIKECNGCHVRSDERSHGRDKLFNPINVGALQNSLPFPNTDPALFAETGETMAQTRARISCATDCSSRYPTADIFYSDIWTDEVAAGRAKDLPFERRYQDLDTPIPTTAACAAQWQANCRTVIHYEDHIHPLWSLSREQLDDDGVTVLSDDTCTSCHSTMDAAGVIRVPLGQLDLSDGQSSDNANQFKAYRELLFNDNEQELDMDALQDRLVQVGIDEITMEPIFATVTVQRTLFANGAISSAPFFSLFEAGGSHAGWLGEAELKLIAEWIDIGGQYYNDPFAVPAN